MRIAWSLSFSLAVLLWLTPAGAVESHRLEGVIDFESGSAAAELKLDDKSSVRFMREVIGDGVSRLKVDLTHIDTTKFTVSTELEAVINRHQKDGNTPYWDGSIQSQYTLVDFKPAREITGIFRYQDGFISLSNLIIGQLNINGTLGVNPPFKADIEATTRYLGIDDFMSLWLVNKKSRFDGNVNGELNLKGSGGNYLLSGDLDTRDVMYNENTFERIRIHLEGYYPYVNIEAFVNRTDGMKFALTGPYDLSDQPNYLNQIRSLKVRTLLVESEDEIEWTFRSLHGDQAGKTEIKYLKRKGEALDNLQRDEGDILGIERTLEF